MLGSFVVAAAAAVVVVLVLDVVAVVVDFFSLRKTSTNTCDSFADDVFEGLSLGDEQVSSSLSSSSCVNGTVFTEDDFNAT